MKKVSIVTIILLLFQTYLFSVDINDPNDQLYDDLEFWQEKGYYRHLPPVQPYPTQLLIELLNKVVESGNSRDVELAEEYLAEIDRKLNVEIFTKSQSTITNDGIGEVDLGVFFDVRGRIGDLEWLTCWGGLGGYTALNLQDDSYYTYNIGYPYGAANTFDMRKDGAGIGSAIDFLGASTSSMSIGLSNIYFSVGFTRATYGPFYNDGVVLSNNADQQGHFELTWRGDQFSFTSMMLVLEGTDNMGQGSYNEKYMVMRSYNWAPLDWLDLGMFETTVYGNRFDALYLIPFSFLFHSQGFSGFTDNSMIGFSARILLPESIEIAGVIYVDDIGYTNLSSLGSEDYLKLAWEAGASWSPGEKWLHKVSFDYTAVMPYMYTHDPKYSTIGLTGNMNPDNYTHAGGNLGVSLSPNSDRFQLAAEFRPWKYINIGFQTSLRRHGNASIVNGVNVTDPEQDNDSGGSGDNIGDGSIYDAGHDDSDQYSFRGRQNFLNQSVIEYVFQIGLDVNTKIILGKENQMAITGEIGYTFERIWNSGRNSNYGTNPISGAEERNHYIYLMLGYNF